MRRTSSAVSLAVVSFALLLASIGAHADEMTPQELLRRMNLALHRVDFQGSFIYQHEGRTDALRIFHEGGDNERERLVSLTGARGEIVRDDGEITCLQSSGVPTRFANHAELRLLPLVPNVRGLGAQYSVTLGGEDRVAGYEARIVDIAPRDPYRYGYRLWVQRDGHLLLRSAVVDTTRGTLEQFMFVALEIGAKPSETDLESTGKIDSAVSPSADLAAVTKPLWNVVEAPAGFKLIGAQRPAEGSPNAEHLIYSDGLASVSVYVEPEDKKSPVTSESTLVRGAVSVHTLDANGMRITALGDVPPATVQAMARGVRASAAD